MSYILDALRKAERERHLGQPPTLAALPPPALPPRRRLWTWLILLALALNAVLLAYFLLPSRPQPPAAFPAVASVAPAVAPPPAPPPAPEPVAVAAIQPAPPPLPAATTSVKAPASKPITPEPPRPSPPTKQEQREPPLPQSGSVRATTSGPEPAPLLETLSASARRGIPALNLDIHVYSPEAANRFVVINGRRYREGERPGENLVLEAVTADGAILRQGDQRFRLSVRR